MSTFVIRPGETDFDVQDRLQGALNLPLNAHGAAQLEETIRSLRGVDLDVIYASPTEPALHSARRLADELDVPLKVLDRLTNIDMGLWQGLSRSEIRQKQPRVFRQWEESPDSVCPPQGETCEDVYNRVRRALRKPLRRGTGYALVVSEPLASVVSHILRGERPRLPGPGTALSDSGRVECLEESAHHAGSR